MTSGPPDDRIEELLDGVRAGSRPHFEALLAYTRTDLLRGIRSMSVSIFAQFEPDDVWQEASLEALRSHASLRARDLRSFRAWFLGIARHRIAKLYRSQRQRVRPRRETPLPARQMRLLGGEVLEESFSSIDAWATREVPDDAHGSLAPLHREQRTAVVMRELFEARWGTLALVLNRPTDAAARALHHRARTTLFEPPL